MIIVDRELERREKEGRPVRVGLVGAGYMGRGIGRAILKGVVGMRLAAVANRSLPEARRVYEESSVPDAVVAKTAAEVDDAVRSGGVAITADPTALCAAAEIDAVVEVTGEVEFGAHVVLDAVRNRKHVVLMNAELDATLGPILKVYADRAGVVFTDTDGDEPGVAMNLFRFVRSIGYHPVAAGNIKGFIDRHRTPDTQREFAAKVHQKPRMITSFADGTKLSMEAAILANATGFHVGTRGMYGPRCAHVKEISGLLPKEQMLDGGLVDYALGAEPGTGAFVIGHNEDPVRQQYMSYFKMGDGPLYVFYTPYHLPHLQLPLTVARAVLFGDPTVTPVGGPCTDVVAVAKRDLKTGEELDGIGGFTCYGTIENYATSRREDLLPMGLSHGCRMRRDVPQDTPITNRDVETPPGRLIDTLRAEQTSHFGA